MSVVLGEISLLETTSKIIDNRGKTVPTAKTGIPLIATNCIKNENLYPVYENIRYVDEETYNNWFRGHPEPRDIILTLKGSQNGAVNLVPDPTDFCIAQDMVALRVNPEKIDPLYLFAALRSKAVQDEIKNLDVSGVIPHFKKSDFDKLMIPLVSREIQEYIGDMYFTLSSKIDLLQRQNETLEKMAETLFRQWFIEEAKEDWEEVTLKDICFVIDNRGKTPPYSDAKTSHPIIEVNALTDFSRNINYSVIRKYVDDKTFDTWFRQYLEPKDILISTVGSIGSIAMFFNGSACIAQNVIGLRSTQKISNLYLYQWLLFMQDEIKELDIGSVQPSIKVPHLLSLSIKIPTADLLLKFDRIINELVEKIQTNATQIQTLQNMRDTLLPKLMNGEVRVKLD